MMDLKLATEIGTLQKDPFMPMADVVKRENRSGLLVRANIDDGTEVTFRDIDEENREVEFIISSDRRDSYGTRFDPKGMDLSQYRKNPIVLYRHMRDGGVYTLPIGNGIPESAFVDRDNRVHMRARFTSEETFPFGYQVYKLIRDGFLHMSSIGAQVLEDEIMEEDSGEQTMLFTSWRLFEFSVVPIGANDDALVVSRDLEEHADLSQAKRFYTSIRKEEDEEPEKEEKEPKKKKKKYSEHDGLWNRDLSEHFNVAEEELPASEKTLEFVSNHLECKMKDVFHNSVFIPSARIGGTLRAMKVKAQEHELEDVRNINHHGGESPPIYEMIQLNSKERDDFLIKGISFYRSDTKRFSTHIYPVWGGMQLDVFTRMEHKEFNREYVDGVFEYARENNPLKNEAFSLSGQFIKKSGEQWDDVILTDHNKEALKRNCDRMNEKREGFVNRGVLLMGKPGTGKTMAGRIIRNEADATFIWMSARDFYRGGSVMSLSMAFSLARELAPAVVFMEDIDNWLDGRTIDFLKTELDGIMRSSGVLTMLTTNYPERLPDALLDRPGRFHDVLHIDVPDKEAREQMVRKWVDGASDSDVEVLIQKTAGYSGAHMFELAQFIKSLRESENVDVSTAVNMALKKLEDQKKLIKSAKKGIGYDRESGDQIKHRDFFEKYSPVSKHYRALMEKLYKRMGLVPPADERVAVQRITDLILSPTSAKDDPSPETSVAQKLTPERLSTLTAQLVEKVEEKRRAALSKGVPLRKVNRELQGWIEQELDSISVPPS